MRQDAAARPPAQAPQGARPQGPHLLPGARSCCPPLFYLPLGSSVRASSVLIASWVYFLPLMAPTRTAALLKQQRSVMPGRPFATLVVRVTVLCCWTCTRFPMALCVQSSTTFGRQWPVCGVLLGIARHGFLLSEDYIWRMLTHACTVIPCMPTAQSTHNMHR